MNWNSFLTLLHSELRKLWSFGRSECSRVKDIGALKLLNITLILMWGHEFFSEKYSYCYFYIFRWEI